MVEIFSRPSQSPRLLYKHRHNLFIKSVSKSPFSSQGSTAPPNPNRLKQCFQSLNRPYCTGLGHYKFQRSSKLHHCIGSKVMAIFLNRWILPIGGVVLGRGYACIVHSKLLCDIWPKGNKILLKLEGIAHYTSLLLAPASE